jgi:lipoprotein Spr
VYGIDVPRTAKEQYDFSTHIKDEDLQEGDLVFFKSGHRISHVGLYLVNNKFVNASTSGGVTISDLNDTYWSKKYAGAGRVKSQPLSLKESR